MNLMTGMGMFTLLTIFFFAKDRPKVGTACFTTAFGLNIAWAFTHWINAGHPPFSNMYEVMMILPGFTFLVFVLVVSGYRIKQGMIMYPFAALLPLCWVVINGGPGAVDPLQPALRSGWLIPHVSSYILSYSAALLAVISLVISFFKDPKKQDGFNFRRLSDIFLKISFPLMTFGLLSGALWANQVWGGYWSWDPKETWSLITWMFYLGYFHAVKAGLRPKATAGFHIMGFTSLCVTFTVVNLLPAFSESLHTYAQ